MAKSNLQLLQEAIAKGDMEAASKIAAKLDKAKPKPKPKPKTKAKEETRQDLETADLADCEYLAKTGWRNLEGQKFIGPDGKEHTYSKRVSMAGTRFVNKFNPEEYAPLPSNLQQVDKKLNKLKIQPRPGQRGALRDISKKVKVRCTICRDIVEVYPWEAETVDGESNFRCSKRGCVTAR
jgi:hypothetical protein